MVSKPIVRSIKYLTIFKNQFEITEGLIGFPHTSCIASVKMHFCKDYRIALKQCTLTKYFLPQAATQLLIGFLQSSVLTSFHWKSTPNTQHSLSFRSWGCQRVQLYKGWESPRDIIGRKSLPKISEIKINSSHSGTSLEHNYNTRLRITWVSNSARERPESHNSACFSLFLRPLTLLFFIELRLSVLGNAGFSVH